MHESSPPLPVSTTVDLACTWRVALDPHGRGLSENWFARDLPSAQLIPLPGSLETQRLGDPVTPATAWTGSIFDKSWFTSPDYAAYREPGHVKVPFWLQPATRYLGAAWYQRSLELPAAWAGRRLVLSLERPHWKTAAWLDDRPLGTCDSLSVPHIYELGFDLPPGPHRLTLRVDNTPDPDLGENSHSVSDHTQGNWNGLVGQLALSATAPVWIDDLQLFPSFARHTLAVRGHVARVDSTHAFPAHVRLSSPALPADADLPVNTDGTFAATLTLPADLAPWDEFHPTVHPLTASLPNGETFTTTFGLRDLRAAGRHFELNHRPLFLRGTLDCAAYPKTGHPPTDVASWRRLFGIVQAHGLNHVRFHSWCPPAAAFAAADALGVYLQVEVASWPNWSTTLGDGLPVDAWLDVETARILRAYGNHPSFVLLCAGNEPGGDRFAPWLAGWVARQKAADPRRLYTSAAGWPELPENDFHVTPAPRLHQWGDGLRSRLNARPPETVSDYADFVQARSAPVVSHEIGQWCAFPNLAELPKYTGYLQPRNFEIFRDRLAAHGLLAQAADFVTASGKLQALCYKEEIESALRTPDFGGFQLLGLSDFPGQGTALVGVLDAFWEEKGYITPDAFRRFCAATVPLARLPRRVFTTDDSLVADIDVAHFGPAPLADATLAWRLVSDAGATVASGRHDLPHLPLGLSRAVLRLDQPLSALPAPQRYRLVVELTAPARDASSPAATFANDWDLFVYPPAARVPSAPPADVLVTASLPDAAARLAAGGTVVLLLPPDRVAPDPQRGPIALGFSSIFWNTAWTNGQAPHTLGVLCDPAHPALAQFPTDPWSNWQWWYPISHAAPLLLDRLPAALRPIVQVIDDWFTSRKLALVFEARVGPGRLLVTSIDLAAADLDPVRRQLRASLLAYAASPAFRPATELTPDDLALLERP